ncbi:4Fe-4S binding protein [Nonomuraea sp. NPDC049695]|uniref:4Fe-4S binding protein n=1 Tax=Nonomuraea sp. NPDC049695 TaxID=3154734 RepID=UPI0034482846
MAERLSPRSGSYRACIQLVDNLRLTCGWLWKNWGQHPHSFTCEASWVMMLNMARIPGVGLAKGLSITLRHMLRKSVTQQYPEVKPALPPRSRGVIALVEENCTSCMLCARECPDWCIYIDSHKETIPAPEGGRPRQRNVLDRFAIDFSLCMYCGICIEVCPFDALFWSPEFEYAEGDIRNLIHEKDTLAAWTQTVPPPPAHDPGAEPPKELTAAPRRPATARTPGAASGTADRPAAKPTQGPRTPRPASTTEEPTTGSPDTHPRESAQPRTSDTGPTAAAEGTPSTAGTEGPQPLAGTEGPPESGPATPSRPEGGHGRPRRPIQNVRGIRPPGALPSRPQDETATSAAEDRPLGRPDTPGEPPADAPAEAERNADDLTDTGRTADVPAESGPSADVPAESGPSAERSPQDPDSSTGQPSPEKLSTASGVPQPKPEPEQQTSAASPRRRRMADPRSIRPPGRLGPDETRESEEDS